MLHVRNIYQHSPYKSPSYVGIPAPWSIWVLHPLKKLLWTPKSGKFQQEQSSRSHFWGSLKGYNQLPLVAWVAAGLTFQVCQVSDVHTLRGDEAAVEGNICSRWRYWGVPYSLGIPNSWMVYFMDNPNLKCMIWG